MNREEYAVSLRNRGYNCAQAVVCAFADRTDLSEEQLFAVSEGFGSGLGCTEGTCGALNAACMLSSLVTSTRHLDHPDSKAATYIEARKLVNEFRLQVQALRCRDIKGIETGTVLCECEDCVRIAVRLVEKYVYGKEDFE